jgi:thioredoxin reductase (NADPH)
LSLKNQEQQSQGRHAVPNPIIFTVDDEPAVLQAIARDLRQHYGRTYRIVTADSGPQALEMARQLKRRGDAIALFLVDQRMPQMEGTDFLVEARKLYPDARKVLLTAYADTSAAIACINTIGLDYYLLKPWHPPEQQLYPILDDLLNDWQASQPALDDGIRVAGALWSPQSHHVKDFLSCNRIPYRWLDIEKDATAAALVGATTTGGTASLPVVFFPDGSYAVAPDNRTLAEKVGLRTQATQPFYDLIIVGAGPAGLGAAVYSASEGLRTALIEKQATGGQAGTSSRIENYLGFPSGISGADLAQRATTQAIRFGVEILSAQEVVKVCVEGSYRIVVLADGSELSCHALLIATGVSVRKLDLPDVARLTGAGIYYGAALTEAAHYRNEHVCVVGGANSAGQGALFFARYAKHVTMLVRGSALEHGISHYLVDQIRATPNVEVCLQAEVTAVSGGRQLEAVTVANRQTGATTTLAAKALFLFIGAAPHSALVADVVERNSAGFIVVGPDLLRNGKRPPGWPLKRDPYPLETSVPGIFAVGDICQGSTRRVATAVGQGAMAIGLVHQYLKTV